MKLKLAILSAFALNTSVSALTPSVSVDGGLAYAGCGFKVKHTFKDVNEKKEEADASKSKDEDAAKKDNDGSVESNGGHGFGGILGVNVAFAKEQWVFGIRGGAAFLVTSPAIEGNEKAQVLKADEQTAKKKELESAADEAAKEKIEKNYSYENAKDKFEEKTVAYSIKAEKGMMFFGGPFVGMHFNEKISGDFGVAFTARKLSLLIKEGENSETTYDHKMSYGMMPSLRASYKFTDMISAFASIGYNVNLSALSSKEEEKKTESTEKTGEKPAKEAEAKTASNSGKIKEAAAGNVLLVSVGVSIKLM